MDVFIAVVDLIDVLVNFDSPEEACCLDFGRLEIFLHSVKFCENLVGQLASMDQNEGRTRQIVSVIFRQTLEDRDDEDCCLAHPRLGLANKVLILQGMRQALDLDVTRLLKPSFSYGPF